MSDQDTQQNPTEDERPTDPAAQEGSGEGAQEGVQDEQVPVGVTTKFDPDQPVRTSAPDPQSQSGVPDLEGGGNEGVEAQEQYKGPVDPAQADATHAEASATDAPATPDE